MMQRAFLFLFLSFLLHSCQTGSSETGVEAYRRYQRSALKPDNPSDVVVKVSTSRQRVYVMEGERMLFVMPATVGLPETPTPHGHFKILRKNSRKRSSKQGFAQSGSKTERMHRSRKPAGWSFTGTPLPYWCEFHRGLAFHTGWIKHRPATDGSIRLHENLAPTFYQLVRVGTPVHIAEWLPEDRSYASIPLPPDAGPLPDEPDTFYLGETYFTRHLSTPEGFRITNDIPH